MKHTAIAALLGATVLAHYTFGQQPGRGGVPNPLLQAFDTDHDGTLSTAEIDAAAAKLRERDTNKDGKLTADELPRGGGERGQGGRSGRGGGFGAMGADSELSKPMLPKDDGEKEGYDAYLKELLPYVRPGGLIVAHNMKRPAPNPRYVEANTTNPDLDSSFVLMDGAGIGITLKKR
jgi:EF hand